MKSKEELLLEIKGVLAYKQGDKVIVNGNVFTTPYDAELVELDGEKEAVIYDLIVPGYCAYEIVIGEEHFFCHESSLIARED